MREGLPSVTAQRVAAYRLGFDRLATPFGDPSADQRLTDDVAGSAANEQVESTARYLRGRTSFFDRVVVNALDRDVCQMVTVGAGYDGRALRYAKPGIRWFEVDHPDTQHDKRARLERLGIDTPDITFLPRDLRQSGLASALVESGYQPDGPSLIVCEGVAVYLDQPVLEALLGELRAVATTGTRLALSLSITLESDEHSSRRKRFETTVAALGEPARNAVTVDHAGDLLAATRWRATEISERSRRAGFVMAAPIWLPAATTVASPTTSRISNFMEHTYHRSGTDSLPGHLEATYGIRVAGVRQLDVGVFRVDRPNGASWVARLFPAARPLDAAHGDAEILRWLAVASFPAERCAHTEPVSVHHGQGVVVTEFAAGSSPPATKKTFHVLGRLLAQLHSLRPGAEASMRAGGAWHHLAFAGGPREEIAAALSLFHDARHRVPPAKAAMYDTWRRELEQADDCHDLPRAFVHPDFVPPNVVATPGGEMKVVDWAGAGWAPRLSSLGFLLWAAGRLRMSYVDAVAAGYGAQVGLEPGELDRLAGAISVRPLVFGCWAFATGRERLPDLVDRLPAIRTGAATIASRARAALEVSAGAGPT
jgi:methyltransferase (TIGR00027 family)